MRIGLDFDNTLVRYDDLFHQAARETGLIPDSVPNQKTAIRDWLREAGREDAWTRLQGEIYGLRIAQAPTFEGVLEFVHACKESDCRTIIVSHKTRHPVLGPSFDLHQAARTWLESRGFFDAGVDPADVYFESTQAEKIDRITSLTLSLFVDDLPEFLLEPSFPSGPKRILFDPSMRHPENSAYCRISNWKDIQSTVLDGAR